MASKVGVQRSAGSARRAVLDWASRSRLRELALLPVLVALVILGALLNDAFLKAPNIVNILQQSSVLAVLVLAEALILIVGKFDLSLESIVGLAPMVAVWLVVPAAVGGVGVEIGPYLGIVVLLSIGAAVGLINGFLAVRLGLNAFIVTLSMLILLRGTTLGIGRGETLYALPEAFIFLGSGSLLRIPVAVWLAGLLYLVFGFFLRYHRIGRAIYAIGGNAEAARTAGIRVERLTWAVFVVGGLLAAVAGLMLTGRLASVTASQGQNLIFTVFAAAVIGGISLNGGRGRIIGALTGVLLLGVIQNILTLSQVASFWIDASFGAIILFALMLTRVTGQRATEN